MEWKVEWKTIETSNRNGKNVEWKWNRKWREKFRPCRGMEPKWNGNGMESGMKNFPTG